MIRLFEANSKGPKAREQALSLNRALRRGHGSARGVDDQDLASDIRNVAHKHALKTAGWRKRREVLPAAKKGARSVRKSMWQWTTSAEPPESRSRTHLAHPCWGQSVWMPVLVDGGSGASPAWKRCSFHRLFRGRGLAIILNSSRRPIRPLC